MGLLFALDPDPKYSSKNTLLLRSSKKRKGLAMGLLLGGVFLGTMFYAAKPLFDKFLEEGALFDKSISYFFYVTVFLYPLLALLCVMYEQQVQIQKSGDKFIVERFNRLAFFKWAKRTAQISSLKQLVVQNWKGALNTAAVKALQENRSDQYATRGHWMLQVEDEKTHQTSILERRARRDDIDWLNTRIEAHFKNDSTT